ncbi:MAG: PIG-L family deacetylase, partial [Gemmatimonadota bacterium]|nr:PIG-L family deacetylase [Gemmatimonadota bacterium]
VQREVRGLRAHPAGEDGEQLGVLVVGVGAEAAYLSLNRGEGGQNLIGAELGEELGLLRSEELLAARRVDGGRQFFTRAYDFGFSKTLDDTWSHWPRDSVLKDVVRIVRRFRPQVLVSVFTGQPRDGHGQHQAAGWVAAEAFQVAGDPARFPELEREEGLTAWTPIKLYRSTRFDTAATTLTLDGGVLDPAIGQSYHQIAMRSRSLHRSQDMGQVQRAGPSVTRMQLVQDRAHAGPGLFDGIETRIEALAGDADDAGLEQYQRDVRGGRVAFETGDRAAARGRLAAAARRLEGIRERHGAEHGAVLGDQARHLHQALAALLGIVPDAVINRPTMVAGETGYVISRVWNAGSDTIRLTASLVEHGAERGEERRERVIPPGAVGDDTLRVTLPDSSPVSTPYFLRAPRAGDLYAWPAGDPAVLGLPFQPPPLSVRHEISWRGATMALTREVAYMYNDQARGEVRLPVAVAPRLSVRVEPAHGIWNVARNRSSRVRVTVTGTAADSIAGRVRLELPAGWAAAGPGEFRFGRSGASAAFDFALTAPQGAAPGDYRVGALAVDWAGREYRSGHSAIDYPHVRPRTHAIPAESRIARMSVTLPRLRRVGYVRGAADRVPEALSAAGLPVEVLEPAALARQPLGGFDAVVIGPRAFETEPALLTANDRLLAYVRAGGLLIVQYQQYGYFRGGYAPYPMRLASREPGQAINAATITDRPSTPGLAASLVGGHDRVTDETAPVRLLDPAGAVVSRPNRLTAA